MRIALIHSYYSSRVPSGENNVVDAQLATLRAAGHEVQLIEQQTDARLARKTYPVEAALTVASGVGPSPLRQLLDFDPDVTHLHNLFPNFGRRWLTKYDGPLVATLHNYRPLCAKATLYRDGHRCTECLDVGHSRPAIRHGCFHDSALATIPSAIATKFANDPVLRRAEVLTTLSEGMSNVYADAGVPRDKLVVLNNYVEPITVGRLVDRLEARGVVERHRDPADRRVWRLHLTDAAEPVLKEIRAYRADVNNAVVRLLGKDAVAELGKSLQTIKAELQDDESEIARPGATKVRSAS